MFLLHIWCLNKLNTVADESIGFMGAKNNIYSWMFLLVLYIPTNCLTFVITAQEWKFTEARINKVWVKVGSKEVGFKYLTD